LHDADGVLLVFAIFLYRPVVFKYGNMYAYISLTVLKLRRCYQEKLVLGPRRAG